MISNRWIEVRQVYWERLSNLLGRTDKRGLRALSREELRDLAFLYRQVAGDLSAIRQDGSAAMLEYRLNLLLARAHAILYVGEQRSWRTVWHFLRWEYPRLFRRLLPFILVSLILFVGGALLGVVLALSQPGFVHALLGPKMMSTIQQHRMWTQSVTSMSPQASSGIMTNNLTVTFFAFAAGLTGGIGTLYLLGWNGILMGVIATVCHQHQMSLKLWSFVAPHGALELPAIIISGGAGLRLAWGLLFPGSYRRGYSLTQAGAESARLVAGVIPMLIVAGTLEGFFSPSAAPVALKFVASTVLFSLLCAWLTSSRSKLPPSPTGEQSVQSSDFSFTSR